MFRYGADAAPAVEDVVVGQLLRVGLGVGEDAVGGRGEGLGEQGGGVGVVVEADDHAAGLWGGFVEAVGGVVEEGDDGVGGVFAHEARVVLHGEVQAVLAFEVAGLAAFGSRAA